MNILQIGLGGFGKKHIATWHALGLGNSLYVAELSKDLLDAHTKPFNTPTDRKATDHKSFLDKVDVVDIVTPAWTHMTLISEALKAGKDVFVEKPMTMTSAEAVEIEALVQKTKRILQIGFHYRYHPYTTEAKKYIDSGALGDIRYINGKFLGFKRPRTDVGVTHSDAIHFYDVITYLLGELPTSVHATMRDFFPRGNGSVRMDDLSISTLEYPSNVLAKIEAGYVQIAEGLDHAVPGALADQSLEISGTKGMLKIDYLNRKFQLFKNYHIHEDGTWKGINEGSHSVNVAWRDPVEAEFEAFINCVRSRRPPLAGALDSGVHVARIIEAAYESAENGQKIILNR